MLTPEEIANLKPGDKVRLCGFAGKSYERYNGIIVEVIEPKVEIYDGKIQLYNMPALKFTPPIPAFGDGWHSECTLVYYNNVELLKDDASPKTCVCPITTIMSVGCKCNGI